MTALMPWLRLVGADLFTRHMEAACDAFADAECSDEGGNEVNCFIHHQHRAALLKQIGL